MTTTETTRPIWAIASDISVDWKKPYFGAVPYLEAMRTLNTTQDYYGLDPGDEIIMYFLANANTWRGPVARKVKAELKALIA